jgi:stress response protein YsnF
MSQTVVGIYNDATEAQNAVDQLLTSGFTQADVDMTTGRNSDTYSTDERDEHESGIERFFKNLFGDDDEEKTRYTRVGENRSIVTVHTNSDEESERAARLLDKYGAIDVDESYREYTGSLNAADDTQNMKIPVIEENLNVGKREVETGGVRLRSRIIKKPVEESIRLREEHVHVERNKVNRPVDETDFDNFKEGTVEMREQAEVPVVQKEARVVEEVSVGKETSHREEKVRDNVRKTEVDVEHLENNADYTNR